MKLRIIEINDIQIAVSSKRDHDGDFIALNQDGIPSRISDSIMREVLGAEYKREIGYNAFEDEPSLTTEHVWETLDEHEEIANG